MAMAHAAFRVLPADLVDDPAATTLLGLTNDTPVLLVAGPDTARDMTISAVTETWVETLWPLTPGQRGKAAGRADLVATQDGRTLVLIPGQALLLLDPLSDDEAERTKRLKPRPARLPDRLFPTDGGVMGLWQRSGGKTLLATLDTNGMRDKSSERAGPTLASGQSVALILRDAASRDVIIAEDHRTGFQIWRQDGPDAWAHLVTDGVGRHGLNASVASGLLWGDRVVLATGSTPAVRQALQGMPLSGELIVLEPDGRVQLLTGELRTSPTGLLAPKLSAAAITTLDPGQFSHLAVDDAGHLIVSVLRRDGSSGLFAIAPDMTVTTLADPCDTILGLVPDQTAQGQTGAVIAQ